MLFAILGVIVFIIGIGGYVMEAADGNKQPAIILADGPSR